MRGQTGCRRSRKNVFAALFSKVFGKAVVWHKAFFNLMICFLFLPMLSVYALSGKAPISDNALLLSESEHSALSQSLTGLCGKYDFDIAIYTEKQPSFDTARASADAFFEEKLGENRENRGGIMLYYCQKNNEYCFSVYGRGLEIFDSNGLAYIESKISDCFNKNEYNSAFSAYVDAVGELLDMEDSDNSLKNSEYRPQFLAFVIVCCFVIPIVLMLVAFKRKR